MILKVKEPCHCRPPSREIQYSYEECSTRFVKQRLEEACRGPARLSVGCTRRRLAGRGSVERMSTAQTRSEPEGIRKGLVRCPLAPEEPRKWVAELEDQEAFKHPMKSRRFALGMNTHLLMAHELPRQHLNSNAWQSPRVKNTSAATKNNLNSKPHGRPVHDILKCQHNGRPGLKTGTGGQA